MAGAGEGENCPVANAAPVKPRATAAVAPPIHLMIAFMPVAMRHGPPAFQHGTARVPLRDAV